MILSIIHANEHVPYIHSTLRSIDLKSEQCPGPFILWIGDQVIQADPRPPEHESTRRELREIASGKTACALRLGLLELRLYIGAETKVLKSLDEGAKGVLDEQGGIEISEVALRIGPTAEYSEEQKEKRYS